MTTTDLQEHLQRTLGSAYAIERELGGGGMSRVFVAEERGLGRRVVVKVLPPELSSVVNAERFVREFQLAARLQHPHIVPLLTAGQADGLLYYTMPLVEGESLRERLERAGELSVAEAVRVLRDVASALAYAHARGVVHRDVKPGNVLLGEGGALVTDFGLAKAVGGTATWAGSLTGTGLVVGTPAYLAPEQAAGDSQVDHRADIYALGCLAYELLTGRPPFTATSAQALLAAHIADRPELVTKHRREVPPALAALVMRCLEKRPADRPQSADEVMRVLDRLATPAGSVEQPAGRPRWNRARLGLAIIGVAILVAGGVATWRLSGRQPAVAGQRKVLAVLPFKNVGPKENEAFADGVTEEVTSHLAALQGLGVISRTSADHYKGSTKPLRQIARELGAEYVLEGSVRWETRAGGGGRVRVTPQLIRVSDDTHLWADRYDADLRDVFEVQSRIAERVAGALDVALGGTERRELSQKPTDNLEAYEHYLRGRSLRCDGWADECAAAAAEYERAVAKDSGFALAWARLSKSLSRGYGHGRGVPQTAATLARARAAADRALALVPNLPEAHVALGYYYWWGQSDRDRALREFTIAAKRRPNDADALLGMASLSRRRGDWETAVAGFQRCVDVDPRSIACPPHLVSTYLFLHDYSRAVQAADRALATHPDQAELYALRAEAYLSQTGDSVSTAREIEEALAKLGARRLAAAVTRTSSLWRLSPALPALLDRVPPQEWGTLGSYLLARALIHQSRGDNARARAYADSARRVLEPIVRREPRSSSPRGQLGGAYAILGRWPEALREARLSVDVASADPFSAVQARTHMAATLARANEQDAAIAELERLLKEPSPISIPKLRTDLLWDPLRGHPRFQRLVGASR